MDKQICFSCNERESINSRYCKECNDKCENCGGSDIYPSYAMIPNYNSVDNGETITIFVPKEEWEEYCFIENPEDPGMGWYWCKICGNGKNSDLIKF